MSASVFYSSSWSSSSRSENAERRRYRLVGRGSFLPRRDSRQARTTPTCPKLPAWGTSVGLDQLGRVPQCVASPGAVVTTKRTEPVGVQPHDPPWWRLLFLLVQGREGEWWRGFVLMALSGLLLIDGLGALLALTGWTGGGFGVGSLAVLSVLGAQASLREWGARGWVGGRCRGPRSRPGVARRRRAGYGCRPRCAARPAPPAGPSPAAGTRAIR